jgi:hypothetical protein
MHENREQAGRALGRCGPPNNEAPSARKCAWSLLTLSALDPQGPRPWRLHAPPPRPAAAWHPYCDIRPRPRPWRAFAPCWPRARLAGRPALHRSGLDNTALPLPRRALMPLMILDTAPPPKLLSAPAWCARVRVCLPCFFQSCCSAAAATRAHARVPKPPRRLRRDGSRPPGRVRRRQRTLPADAAGTPLISVHFFSLTAPATPVAPGPAAAPGPGLLCFIRAWPRGRGKRAGSCVTAQRSEPRRCWSVEPRPAAPDRRVGAGAGANEASNGARHGAPAWWEGEEEAERGQITATGRPWPVTAVGEVPRGVPGRRLL